MDMKVCPFLSWLGYLTIFSVFSHQPEQYDPLYGSNSNIGGSQYGKGGDGEKNLLCCKNFSSYSKILMIPLFSPHWLWFNEIIKFLASEVVNSNSSGAWPVMGMCSLGWASCWPAPCPLCLQGAVSVQFCRLLPHSNHHLRGFFKVKTEVLCRFLNIRNSDEKK